jgi:uncharacterized phage-associated protein
MVLSKLVTPPFLLHAEFRFNEKKATQVAALLIQLRGSQKMKYLKLLKLVYLIDRESLARWGRPLSTDRHVSMDKGPVPSRIYNLITEEQLKSGVWSAHIQTVPGYDVQLLSDPGNDELSQAEDDLIREVFQMHGHKNRWRLVEELHQVPEWRDPDGSMIPISIRDILTAVGKTPDEISEIERQIEADVFADSVLQPV